MLVAAVAVLLVSDEADEADFLEKLSPSIDPKYTFRMVTLLLPLMRLVAPLTLAISPIMYPPACPPTPNFCPGTSLSIRKSERTTNLD